MTGKRHTIACTMGAKRLLSYWNLIDHVRLYLFETWKVVSRQCTVHEIVVN